MKYAKYYISILLLILVPSYISANVSKNKFNKTEMSQNDEEREKIEKVIDGIHYEIVTDTNGMYADIKGIEALPKVKIPDFIKIENKKIPVKSISDIGTCATVLKEIKLPKTLEYITGFKECRNLEEIIIPESVVEIGPFAFWKCGNLRKVIFQKGLSYIDECAFLECTSLYDISLPPSLKIIGSGAFSGCTSLHSVSIPNSIEEIDEGIFSNCTALTEVHLNEIEKISDRMFSGCKSLKTITIGETLKSIGNGCFEGCTALEHFVFPTHSGIESIGENAFKDCTSFEGSLPKGVFGLLFHIKHIGYGAFQNCSSLKEEVHLPDSVYDYTFNGCKSLETVTSGSNTKYVGKSAFSDCSSLKNLGISGVQYIGEYAFLNCKSLEYLNLEAAQYIGNTAFGWCSSLKSINFSENLNYIGDAAFQGCIKLKYANNLTANVRFANDKVFEKITDIAYLTHSYQYYASNVLEDKIKAWQAKKKYESTEEWRKRVNLETRQKKYNELKDSLHTSYIKHFSPDILKCRIVSYDADASVFSLKTENLNIYTTGYDTSTNLHIYNNLCDDRNVFVKVPANEAEAFEKNWDKVILNPTYCITKDYLDVASCTFTLNGKTYKSPVLYDDETADLNIELPPLDLDLLNSANQDMAAVKDKTIDKNIPTSDAINDKTFVVIIGNENYKQVARVPYALNDAIIFKNYCKKTLGVPDKNIRSYPDATYAMMLSSLKDIQNIAEAYKGDINVIFYYAGHGIPSEKDFTTYLLPIDADGSQTDICMPVSRLYQGLAEMKAKSVTIFMDACFSGSLRGDGMITSARGVAIKAKEAAPQGNMVIFTAASGDETAYPYKEKGHGMFTYYLLKKLHDTKGDVTLGELGQYITDNVRQQSVVVNRRVQTPTVMPATTLGDGWKDVKLK